MCEKVLDRQGLPNVFNLFEGAARLRARLVMPLLAAKGVHGLIDQRPMTKEQAGRNLSP